MRVCQLQEPLLQQLLAYLNFNLDPEDLSFSYRQKSDFYELWQQHKKLKTVEVGEAWPDTFNRDRYICFNLNPITKFTSSSRSTEFKNILQWNISQMITKTISTSTRIVISNAMNWGINCEYNKKSMETEITIWSEFSNGGKAIVEQILASEHKSKRAWLWESQYGIWVGKLTIWVRSESKVTKVNHLR